MNQTEKIHEILKQGQENKLRRTLGPLNITLIGIGGIIGAGIFVLTGQAAAQYAGPGIVLSFVLSGVACAFAALCYAEFASMLPIAGSAYTYAFATMGQFVAWIIGWDLILEYLFSASTVSVGWSGYMVSFLKDIGIIIPKSLCSAPLVFAEKTGWAFTGSILNLPAMFIILIITGLLVIGIKESATFNNIIVFIKLSVVLLFIFFCYKYFDKANWTPFIPENAGSFGEYGISGIFRGAGVIFFAYIGFDAVSTVAQESKNPQRDMPIGIIGSLLICTILYIVVSAILTGIVSYKLLNVPDPIAVALDTLGNTYKEILWIKPFIKLGAIAGLSSVVLVMLMSQPRIFYSMSRDGLLPEKFSHIHKRFKTPYITTIITGSIAMVIAGLFPIGILGELVSIGTLSAFTLVCIGVLFLRYKHPDLPRNFKTPWVPFVPIMGALTAMVQMFSLPVDTWLRLIIWLIIGLVIYFGYSKGNAKRIELEKSKGKVEGR